MMVVRDISYHIISYHMLYYGHNYKNRFEYNIHVRMFLIFVSFVVFASENIFKIRKIATILFNLVTISDWKSYDIRHMPLQEYQTEIKIASCPRSQAVLLLVIFLPKYKIGIFQRRSSNIFTFEKKCVTYGNSTYFIVSCSIVSIVQSGAPGTRSSRPINCRPTVFLTNPSSTNDDRRPTTVERGAGSKIHTHIFIQHTSMLTP